MKHAREVPYEDLLRIKRGGLFKFRAWAHLNGFRLVRILGVPVLACNACIAESKADIAELRRRNTQKLN